MCLGYVCSCTPKEPYGLVALAVKRKDDNTSNVTFKSSSKNIITLEVSIEFEAGVKRTTKDETVFVSKDMRDLIEQGKRKLVYGTNGGISFAPIE